jgi:membrane protease YdiL (CAAX protease family)
MKGAIVLATIKKRAKLFLVFLTIILCYSFFSIPFLFLYVPEDIKAVPLISRFFYNKLQAGYNLINTYIETSTILSYVRYSELVKSTYAILIQGLLLFLPVIFYKRGGIKYYISRAKNIGNIDMRGKLLYGGIILSTVLYIVTSFVYFINPQDFPPFNFSNMIFWVRYSFIICFLGPFGEELFFRGIVFDEIKHCYNLSPRFIIFYQALIFYVFHFLFSNNFSLVMFLIGIITGVFVFYTNSLLYSIIFHICYNSFFFLCHTGVINLIKYKTLFFVFISLMVLSFLLIILFIHLFINHMKTILFSVENPNKLCNTISKPE